jgi:hypothetical protein
LRFAVAAMWHISTMALQPHVDAESVGLKGAEQAS